MRWTLMAVALLITVAGLLYGGGVVFMSSLSNAMAPPGAHGSGTVAATTAPMSPDRSPAGSVMAMDALTLASSPAPQPGVSPVSQESSPEASEQRVLQSRKALETVDPKELLRQGMMPK